MTSKPKYKYFAELIEEKISSGKYSINDYLPGERQLSNENGLSRIAVRMGLKLLREKGRLSVIPGRGYRVLPADKKQFMRKSEQIGVIFAGPQSNYPSNLMTDGIFEVLHGSDYQFIFASCQLSVVRQRKIIKAMVERGVDGLLVVPEYRKTRYWEEPDENGNFTLLKKIHDNGTPVVLLDRSLKPSGLPCVCNDDPVISAMAVKYLANRGHRQIVSFQPVNTGRIVLKRYNGYIKAMRQLSLEPMVHNLDKNASPYMLSPELCKVEFQEMFKKFPNATGFIIPGAFDLYLHNALCCINSKRKMEYVCIDQPAMHNIKFTPYIERPMRQIGHRAAEKIIKLLHHKSVKQLNEYLKPELVTKKPQVSVYVEV